MKKQLCSANTLMELAKNATSSAVSYGTIVLSLGICCHVLCGAPFCFVRISTRRTNVPMLGCFLTSDLHPTLSKQLTQVSTIHVFSREGISYLPHILV